MCPTCPAAGLVTVKENAHSVPAATLRESWIVSEAFCLFHWPVEAVQDAPEIENRETVGFEMAPFNPFLQSKEWINSQIHWEKMYLPEKKAVYSD